MKFFLDKNRGNFDSKYRNGLASEIWVPLNIRSASGRTTESNFTTSPDPESVKLSEWIEFKLTKGDITLNATSTGVANLHHGSFADDAAAATGSVPVGGVYYNTTTQKLHTRMS